MTDFLRKVADFVGRYKKAFVAGIPILALLVKNVTGFDVGHALGIDLENSTKLDAAVNSFLSFLAVLGVVVPANKPAAGTAVVVIETGQVIKANPNPDPGSPKK